MTFLIGIITTHLTSLIHRSIEGAHHFLRILLGHFDIRELAQQVDMTHILSSLHMLVDILHHLTGIETVILAEVDEQALIACLRLTLSTWGRRATTSTLASRTTVTLIRTFASCRRNFNLGSVGVICEELAELHAHNLLYHVLLVDELEVAVDVSHKRFDFIVVDVGLDYLVHHLVELLLANLLRCGDIARHKTLAYLLLYRPHLALLAGVDNGDGRTLLAGTSCTSTAVGIALDVVGQTEVDDMRKVVNVKTTGSHVGCHEQLRDMLAELLHGEVALLLAEVAMQTLGVISVVYQFVGYLLRVTLCAAENDAEYLRVVIDYTLECEVFVLGVHHVIDMVDVLGTLVAASNDDFLVFVEITLGYSLYLAAHGRREEQSVAVLGNTLQYLVDALGETHIEHLVSLIEHYIIHVVEHRLATVHEVDESSRCGYDYLRSMAQCTYLVLDGCAAIYGHDVYSLHILREVLQVVGYLEAQLSCGTEDKCLRVTAVGVETLEHGNAECGSLARTGLCQCDDVVLTSKQIGNDFLLYGHRTLKAQLRDGAANLFADAQFFKCLQYKNINYVIISPFHHHFQRFRCHRATSCCRVPPSLPRVWRSSRPGLHDPFSLSKTVP